MFKFSPIQRLLIPFIAAVLVIFGAAPVSAAVPGVVAGLDVVADIDNQTITASWSAPTDDGGSVLTGYAVSLAGAGSDSASVDATTTSFTFTGLGPGVYTVTVSAVNGEGTGDGASGSATIPTTPSVPTNIDVEVSGQSVTVSWDASADDGFDPFIAYVVSFGDEFDQTELTSITFTGVAPGTYTAEVEASNTGGTSDPVVSGSFTVDPPVSAPSAPTGVSASVSGQSVLVSWGVPVDDGGDSVITYSVSGNGSTGSTQGTSLTLSNVAPGTFTVSVTASNSGGSGGTGTSNEVTVDPPVSAPSVPTGVSASVSGQSVTVSWTGSADDGGDPFIAYLVAFGAESGQTESTSITFDNVAPGTYTAGVQASNTGGTSAAGQSGSFTVDAPISPPSAPQGQSASVTEQTVNVSWSSPADDGGDSNITYEITLGALTPQSTQGTSVSFSNVPAGTYTATVTASNLAGEGGSATTNSVTVAAPADVPGAPGGLTVTETGASSVAVSWTAPAANGSPIIEYEVSLNGSVTSFPSSPASFSDLTPGVYSVTVAARNGVGTGPSAGPESFTIAVPIEPPGVPGNVAASVSGQTVNVSWTRPDDGGDPELDYTVTLSNGASQTVSGTSAQFNNIPAGNYTASVTANNSAGPSAAGTSPAFSVFSTPSAPRNLAAAADGSSVIATWDPPASNGNRSIRGYAVALELDGSVVDTKDVDDTISSVRFDDRSPAIYTVVVTARNGVGTGPEALVDVEVGSTAPSAPTNVSGSAVFQTVTITWDPPLSGGNTALTGYEVTVGTVEETVDSGTRSLVLVDIEPGSYVAEVRAINSGGKSLRGESNTFKTETVFAPFESSEDLVAQQYADFLGRAPDRAGLNYWQGVLGADRNQGPILIESFMRSAEFAPRRSVARLYLAFFDRAPDRAGFDYWTGVLLNGGRLNDIAAAFAGSAEFRNTYGELNDAEFIALVYNNVLLRVPDLEGFRFWLERLDDPGVTRGDLMVAFSESAEFKRNSAPAVDVIMTYRGMLDRAPDSAGFVFWVGSVAGRPDSLQTLIFNFLVSEEYSNRVR